MTPPSPPRSLASLYVLKSPVPDTLGLPVVSERLAAPFVVRLVVSLIPDNFATVLKRQDVGGDSVQKPAIVADDNRAAAEVVQSFLE